jgi:hypothetical protein
LADELDGSAADLQRLAGEPPAAFAYPFGDVDEAARCKVAARYAVGYGIARGVNRPAADPHTLRRTAVLPAYPGYEFLCQLRLGRGPRDTLRSLAHRVLGWAG